MRITVKPLASASGIIANLKAAHSESDLYQLEAIIGKTRAAIENAAALFELEATRGYLDADENKRLDDQMRAAKDELRRVLADL